MILHHGVNREVRGAVDPRVAEDAKDSRARAMPKLGHVVGGCDPRRLPIEDGGPDLYSGITSRSREMGDAREECVDLANVVSGVQQADDRRIKSPPEPCRDGRGHGTTLICHNRIDRGTEPRCGWQCGLLREHGGREREARKH